MGASANRRFALATAAAGLLLAGMGLASSTERPEPRHHTVTIDATSYGPRTITASVGDTITWVNQDLVPHTATAKNGRFDSGDIPPGKSWAYVVKTEGLFAYFCSYHPTMKGTLRARPAAGS